jgi:hypothetical protein
MYPRTLSGSTVYFIKWAEPVQKLILDVCRFTGVELRVFLDGGLAAQLVRQLMARLKGLGA